MGPTSAKMLPVKCRSQPVSRILSRTTIPLALRLLAESSNLPGGFGRAVLKRHPIWSCSVRGFACHPCCHERGALLPHHFTLTLRLALAGSLRAVSFLCHYSVRLPCPGVTRRTALRSSDFPPAFALSGYGGQARRNTEVRRPAVVWPAATTHYPKSNPKSQIPKSQRE